MYTHVYISQVNKKYDTKIPNFEITKFFYKQYFWQKIFINNINFGNLFIVIARLSFMRDCFQRSTQGRSILSNIVLCLLQVIIFFFNMMTCQDFNIQHVYVEPTMSPSNSSNYNKLCCLYKKKYR